MNKLKKFLAYGVVLETSLDLSDYLVEGGEGRYSLTLSERAASAPRQALKIHTLVFKSHGRILTLFSDRETTHSVMGQPWCLEIDDVVRFYWGNGQESIEYEALDQCTDQLLAFWAIHIFLPLYFTLEGMYEFIHACAVEVADDSILFVAPSHGGKSTLTDFFIKKGHSLISDDKVATYLENKKYYAVPSHPNHRPYRNFEDLGCHVPNFSARAKPIDAFYALHGVDSEAGVKIIEISGHRKFAHLLPSYLFNFSFLKAKRLKYLASMLNTVPFYRLEVPWNIDRLSEVYDVICNHRVANQD